MRVIASLGLLTMLCGCGPIVYQVQQQMRGFQTAYGPCRPQYTAWQRDVANSGPQTKAAAGALLTCLRRNQVTGPVDLSVHEIYGATPPPLLRTGVPNENPEVLTHSLLLSATHYTP